jgi:death-on-curing protein
VTYYLTLEDFTELGVAVLAAERGEFLIGDIGLLQSALSRPQTTVFGEDAYSSLSRKAAAMMQSIARNHALVDGNKRLAWAATRLFLMFNDIQIKVPDVDEAEHFVVYVARGSVELDQATGTIELWSVPVSNG